MTMEIKGKVHLFFEQSGTFKNQFIKLGIPAEDYDIQNNFGETDHVIDLFAEIETYYNSLTQRERERERERETVFDRITSDDLIIAFFPCIYFSALSQMNFSFGSVNNKNLSTMQKAETVIERSHNREYFWGLAVKMISSCMEMGLRLIMENPWNEQTFLKANFILPPTFVDTNRTIRGDHFVKPTAYWFINCEPTHGLTEQIQRNRKIVQKSRSAERAGLCSEERSMISPDYARAFICDFILGKPIVNSQLSLF